MAFVKKTWKNRQSEYPGRRKLNPTGIADTYDVVRDEGLTVEEGDPFNAQTMNDLESRIGAEFGEVGIALAGKVDNAPGMGLSKNNYDDAEKSKVTGALQKTGGTMSGQLVAGGTQDLATAQVRNVVISSTQPTGVKGMIWIEV